MIYKDQLYRYILTRQAVRGELVILSQVVEKIIAGRHYPLAIQILLAEMLAATSLLSATLKYEGEITVQIQGDGPLSLAVVNGNHLQQMKGVARIKGDIPEHTTLSEMVGNGYLVITISPKTGEPYQGIIALTGENFTQLLENYFSQSEQLLTKLWFFHKPSAEYPVVGGILLQALPNEIPENSDDFNYLMQLTNTLTEKELFTLPITEILHRLYHQEEVLLLEQQPISFHCSCSKTRSEEIIMSLPPDEVDQLIAEDGRIDLHCDYCNNHYIFNKDDIDLLRNPPSS